MTLTKAHIVENLFAENLFTKGESAQIIETLSELIKQTLKRGDDVIISGFGKFSVKEKHQRMGRNPLFSMMRKRDCLPIMNSMDKDSRAQERLAYG